MSTHPTSTSTSTQPSSSSSYPTSSTSTPPTSTTHPTSTSHHSSSTEKTPGSRQTASRPPSNAFTVSLAQPGADVITIPNLPHQTFGNKFNASGESSEHPSQTTDSSSFFSSSHTSQGYSASEHSGSSFISSFLSQLTQSTESTEGSKVKPVGIYPYVIEVMIHGREADYLPVAQLFHRIHKFCSIPHLASHTSASPFAPIIVGFDTLTDMLRVVTGLRYSHKKKYSITMKEFYQATEESKSSSMSSFEKAQISKRYAKQSATAGYSKSKFVFTKAIRRNVVPE
ncbi:hypothetical protein BLNAU_21892 [Blattamonas nauphoetae]|uniref:Uncharacterized protein n=1 Tax=Blattamonas nauphoetae TaxID=2049346 RepID=A0ABQ9WX04_9EUKA|nr:hypothetical protein BLNAU_21892 [Blattamonas nauphoetae]